MFVDSYKKLNISLIILAVIVLLALLDSAQDKWIGITLALAVIAASYACFFFQKQISLESQQKLLQI